MRPRVEAPIGRSDEPPSSDHFRSVAAATTAAAAVAFTAWRCVVAWRETRVYDGLDIAYVQCSMWRCARLIRTHFVFGLDWCTHEWRRAHQPNRKFRSPLRGNVEKFRQFSVERCARREVTHNRDIARVLSSGIAPYLAVVSRWLL